MEVPTLLIISTLFIILLVVAGMSMIMLAYRKKTRAEMNLREIEITKQREISEGILVTQENERRKIGMELHDELGPSFTAARLFVRQLQQHIVSGNFEKLDTLSEQISENLNSATNQVSNVSRLLYPVSLTMKGLIVAIEDVINRSNQIGDIRFNFSAGIESIEKELIKIALYRIVQELCNNATKHSKAKLVEIHLAEDINTIILNYTDDGVGFDNSIKYDGVGLNSLRNRAEALGGSIAFSSKIEIGVKILIIIPKNRE
jgi:signal transduction histidine kinase